MTAETIYVGDPIDVITGNQFDVALDFQIAWDFPFRWQRLYSVARRREQLAFGWGHTHSYDHRLAYNIDGLLYVDPRGTQYQFTVPRHGAMRSEVPGGSLRAIGRHTYRVRTRHQPACEFQFIDPERPARLLRVFRGCAFHLLGYDQNGAWRTLAYANEPEVQIEGDGERIQALIWTGPAAGRNRTLWRGEYDTAGNLVEVTDVRSATQHFEYDSRRRMIRHTDRLGYAFLMAYDGADRCVRSSGEDGVQDVRLHFRPDEKRTLMTRADGGEWQFLYQREGITGVLDPYGGITRRVYGEQGGLIEEIGPSGETLRKRASTETGLVASPFGPPAGPALPLGDPWFEVLAARTQASDPLGWDGFGASVRRASITLPAHHAYRRWPVRLPAGVVHCVTFGAGPLDADNPIPSGGWARPAPKKPMFRSAPAGTLQFDSFGLLMSHALPDGKRCHWQYDANGNITRHVDYEGSEWLAKYASWNHCVKEVDPLGQKTTFEYNSLEKLVRLSDPGGTRTELAYDLKDRMIERARDGNPLDRFSYDLSDRLVQATRGDDEVRIRFEYGPHGRPVSVAPEGQPLRTYEYDARGRLLAVTADGKPMLRFAYDHSGALTEDAQFGLGVQQRFTALKPAETIVLGRFPIRYSYDRDRDAVTITDPTGRKHNVQQLDLGVYLLERANGVRELSQYNWNGRCLARSRFRGSETFNIWSRTYRYSGVGTLLEAADSLSSTSSYQYDAAHRLTGVNGPSGPLSGYSLDAAGNVCAAPELHHTVIEGNRLTSVNGREIFYDNRGNIIEDRSGPWIARYTYDSENHLVACDAGGETITFTYDALGRRLTKATVAGAVTFVWDGERLAAEISPAGELRVYVYADADAMTPFLFVDYDSVASDPKSGLLRHVFTDQLSCPVLVEDQNAHMLWHARMAPYGQATVSRHSRLMLNLRWPGHYFDIETGLHYNRHRYYSPTLCRYIQPDPLDVKGGVNVYAYTSRPLDRVDVNGLAPCPKKPMIEADEDDPRYQRAKQKADEIAENIRAALQRAVDRGSMHPLDAAGVTLATMVVVRKNGTYEVVLTGNVNPASMPRGVRNAAGGLRVVGFDDDRPPPVRQGDEDWRYSRTRPDGNEDPSTHRHAEQRGLRATDCDNNVKGVAYIAPTRPCCEGCSNAIQTSSKQGGWGGDNNNVSDLGQQPGQHGDHW